MKQKFTIIPLLCLFYCTYSSTQQSFNQRWYKMQADYKKLCQQLKMDGIEKNRYFDPFWSDMILCQRLKIDDIKSDNYFHPFWSGIQKKIRQLILGKPNAKFLHHPSITGTMVRMGTSAMQRYEVTHLKCCISSKIREQLTRFTETNFSHLPRECKEFDCSTNSLGHLFYASNILGQFEQNDQIRIVELGGGYGNLARIFKMARPEGTIVILDIPEFIALQSLFLGATLPATETIVHTRAPSYLKKGAIHLIPIFFLDDLEIDADVFVSTFGISETPMMVQNKVIDKKFFNAKLCYIAGQLKGWNSKFENHTTMLNGIRSLYSSVSCHPFHSHLTNQMSYEVAATLPFLP